MSRPTLYLDHWSTNQRRRNQGLIQRVLSAQVGPKQRTWGDGWVAMAAPRIDDLHAVQQQQITVEEYEQRCRQAWGAPPRAGDYHADAYSYGNLRVADGRGGLLPGTTYLDRSYVQDGDGLCCTCARPDSPARTHPCHLEWLADRLARAVSHTGIRWRIILYDDEIDQRGVPLPKVKNSESSDTPPTNTRATGKPLPLFG
jgi:hypothetical protein